MRNENKETNQGKKAIGESMGSRMVLALIVVAVIVTACLLYTSPSPRDCS